MIDQFVLNQNVMTAPLTVFSTPTEMQALLVRKLRRSIQVPGKVLMCLHPYDRPIVLRRSWCMFEAFQALELGADLLMCFAPDDERAFYDALQAQEFDAKRVVAKLDAQQARATEPSDQVMILREIEEACGLQKYNAQLRKFLGKQYNLVALHVMQTLQRRASVDAYPTQQAHHPPTVTSTTPLPQPGPLK